MIGLLLAVGTAWPCAALLTRDGGALATSDAQEVILERNDAGVLTRYRVSYDGDAESFGWLIVTRGTVGEGDITEADEGLFDELREATQPRITVYEMATDADDAAFWGGRGRGCGCNDSKGMSKSADDVALSGGGSNAFGDTGGISITAEGFAGPFAYTALAATDSDALVNWLEENDFSLGETASTLEHYIEEGDFTFVAVSLIPDTAETPGEGRTLPALAIQSDAEQMEFPARMALTGMAEELRTTVWVLGEETAEAVEGWGSAPVYDIGGGSDPMLDYDELLRDNANAEEKRYVTPFTGEVDGRWVTRFDTLAHRSLHTDDPVFDYTGHREEWHLEIIVDEGYEGAAIWFWMSIFGMGIASRRRA
jgi:hypothetical protein